MGDFERVYDFTRKPEGRYSDDKDDKGGPTNYGITTGTFHDAQKEGLIDRSLGSVKDITPDDAIRVYRQWYWKGIKGGELPQDVATVLFDTAVNSGPPAAIRMLQKVLKITPKGIMDSDTLHAIRSYQGNLAQDLLDARLQKYEEIVEKHPKQKKFIRGWRNRINDLHYFLEHGSIPTAGPASRQPAPRTLPGAASLPAGPGLTPTPFMPSLLRRNALTEALSSLPPSTYGYGIAPLAPYQPSWPGNLLEAPLFTGFYDGTGGFRLGEKDSATKGRGNGEEK